MLLAADATAQSSAEASGIEMADALRAEGKLVVVIAVLLVILIGIFVYLLLLDKRLKNLEAKADQK